MDQAIFEKLRLAQRLPSPPGAALRILEITEKDNVPIAEISSVISTDPALASRILKFANSPMAGFGRGVSSIQQAVMLIGLRAVKMMSLGFSLVADTGGPQCSGFDYNRYWKHSLACASFSRALARIKSQSPPEEAFTAGLLANFGRIVMTHAFSEKYGSLCQTAGDDMQKLVAAEEHAFGTNHMELGAMLMEEWKLPNLIFEAVKRFRVIPEPRPCIPDLTMHMYAADGLASELITAEKTTHDTLRHQQEVVCGLYGMDEAEFEAFFDKSCRELTQLGEILSVDVGKTRSIEDLQAMAQEQMLNLSLSTQMENRQVREENQSLQHRVRIDALTQIGNREAFDECLSIEIQRASRDQSSMALIILDVDHFKKFNDVHGHQAGDHVLKSVASCLQRSIRKVDSASRYGGEEFAVVAPQAGLAGAKVLAERVRQGIESMSVEFEGKTLSVTVSLGVAVWPGPGGHNDSITPTSIIKEADAQLYASKEGGRNRCSYIVLGQPAQRPPVAAGV